MTLPNGFQVKVFAAEPDVVQPFCFCFDERGRMWVAENLNYRTRGMNEDEPLSRISIYEDTSGDVQVLESFRKQLLSATEPE